MLFANITRDDRKKDIYSTMKSSEPIFGRDSVVPGTQKDRSS